MVDYADSAQLNLWSFMSPEELHLCQAQANLKAREYLAAQSRSRESMTDQVLPTAPPSATAAETTTTTTSSSKTSPHHLPVQNFACGFSNNIKKRLGTSTPTAAESDPETQGPWETAQGHAFLTPQEENTLVSFYVSKLPTLMGPLAQVSRLRRESKVTATAAMLLRRFFLSNSVMMFDPKCIMVAAAFLGSKVEDATADIRHLEEGTQLMNAPVTASEIIPAEIALLAGIRFHLLCFHPYKAVLALTEDLRTFLKSDKGQALVDRPVSGQDLKPMYDAARQVLDDVMVSELTLLYTPGQLGLAALMVAQEYSSSSQEEHAKNHDSDARPAASTPPRIDWTGYLRQRFPSSGSYPATPSPHHQTFSSTSTEHISSSSSSLLLSSSSSSASHHNPSDPTEWLERILPELCQRLRDLKQGAHGCGNYLTDWAGLKAIHKKLKKVRAWGQEADPTKSDAPKSKKKKRQADSTENQVDSTETVSRKRPKL